MWEVEISFTMRWGLDENLGSTTWIPSFSVFDLGQELGLGTTNLVPLQWNYSTEIELLQLSINDMTFPFGQVYEEKLYISNNDLVQLQLIPVYEGTTIPVNIDIEITASITGGTNDITLIKTYSSVSSMLINLTISKQDFPNSQAFIEVSGSIANSSIIISSIQIDVIIDDESPRLSFNSSLIRSLRSDQLQMIPLTFQINEPQQMLAGSVRVNWKITGPDFEDLDGAGSAICNLLTTADGIWYYDVVLNITFPNDVDLSKEHNLFIWISGSDIAGNELIGTGSSESQHMPELLVYEFLPKLTSLTFSEPLLPGELIIVNVSLENLGYVGGNATLQLLDGEDVLAEESIILGSKGEAMASLQVESWRSGEYNLSISLNGITLAEEINFEIQSTQLVDVNSTILSSTLFIIFLLLGFAIFIIHRSRNNPLRDEFLANEKGFSGKLQIDFEEE